MWWSSTPMICKIWILFSLNIISSFITSLHRKKMSAGNKASLFFIPFPVISHLVAAVKMANLLADHAHHLQITFLVNQLGIDTKITSYIKNSPESRINIVEVPQPETNSEAFKNQGKGFLRGLFDNQRGPVRDAVAQIMKTQKLNSVAGFVVDMFCTSMIDVANELGAPTYIFFTCNASFLGFMFHVQSLKDDHDEDVMKYKDSNELVPFPGYVNPVPTSVWPYAIFESEDDEFFALMRKFRQTKGIIVNTFLEFEPFAIKFLSEDRNVPPVYPVGPIIQDGVKEDDDSNQNPKYKEIIDWLDEQPDSSVVFLCFGSNGCFEEDQVKEIAVGLERSGHRFLWSLRKPLPKGQLGFPGEYENPGEVLPEGFLDRTKGHGKVIGWAPQMAVLAHRAVGGFVSHCGWNSTLESLWYGVPIAAWPLAAEQQANAFQLVKELEMAVEIKMDYRKNSGVIVPAEKIETAIKELMDPENEMRVKVNGLKEKSRRALLKGGSSDVFLGKLIDDVLGVLKH